MDVYEAINKRLSVRAYQDKPVAEEMLRRVLEAARAAPTARNRQEFRIVVVREPRLRAAAAAAAEQPFIGKASVIIALVGLTPDEVMHCEVPTDPVDGAIVLDHITLAAAAEGLGTCWIGHFNQDECRRILSVPKTAKIIELLALGHPAGRSPSGAKSRKPLATLVCYDGFD